MLKILQGHVLDKLRELPDESVNCVVTSPPYWGLRDYGVDGQFGLESTVAEFIENMTAVFRDVRRVLRGDGTLWLNMGDSYNVAANKGRHYSQTNNKDHAYWRGGHDDVRSSVASLKPKDLVGQPWRLAFALQADGWYLRQDIIWNKPNPMPESVSDRCTKSHEYIFLLTKRANYFYDAAAILEPVSPGTHARLSQDVAAQIGSHRANGGSKTNGPMKAVGRKLAGKNSRENVDRVPRPREKYNPSFDQVCCMPVTQRNKRSVWTVATAACKDAHFATFPPALITPCILAGCPQGGVVLDPFAGSGTTGMVALERGRRAILIELNPEYVKLIKRRCRVTIGLPINA